MTENQLKRQHAIGQNGNEGLHYDNVLNTKHYQLLDGVEVIDVRESLLMKIDAAQMLNAVEIDLWSRAWEYLTRFMEKGGMEDLKKAENYLHRLNTGEWLK